MLLEVVPKGGALMLFVARTVLALAAAMSLAASAAATEYVLSTGVALPQGEPAEVVSMAGIRRVLAAGIFGEASVARIPSAPGGACVSTLAFARPWGGLRTGAGVLAMRAPDKRSPGRPETVRAAGFQFACGVQLPLAAGLGMDVDARYVFFDRPEGQTAPDRFATRYWTLTLGLAILAD
jgi:hypothetical protein